MGDKTVVKNSRGYLAWRRNLPFFIHNLYFTPDLLLLSLNLLHHILAR